MRETLGVLLGFFLAAVLGYLISEIAQKEQEKEVLESYMDSLQEIYEVDDADDGEYLDNHASDDEYGVARREAIQSGFGERGKNRSRKAQNAVNKKCNYAGHNFSFSG